MITAVENTQQIHAGTIEKSARLHLARTGYPTLNVVQCTFRDGRITLRGQVPSFYHKQLAQEALREVAHVSQIINNLEVSRT